MTMTTYSPASNPAKALVDQLFTDWGNLFERMRSDADLFNLVKLRDHVLDVDGHEIANSVWLVLNDAADFAWRVESLLNSAVEQASVTCESKRFDTAYVENYIKAAYNAADELLSLKGQFPLNAFLDQQNCRRGSEAVFFNFHIEKGQLIPTITPWDTGYLVAIHDGKGLSSTGYKCYRSKDQILSEYPDAVTFAKTKDIEALNILTRDTSQLWVEGRQVRIIKNKLGYVPIVYRRVPMGSMLMDVDSLQYQGESIIFLIRDLLPELNRFVSIIQSLNLQELDHALQIKKPRDGMSPSSSQIPTVDEVTKPGTVNEVESPGGFEKMPIGELRAQAEILHKMIQDRVDKVMNNFQAFPGPRTATEILALNQSQETTILPRLANRGLLKQDGAKMFIKQTIAECEKYGISEVELDGQNWEIARLKGTYKIEFKYSFKDSRMDAARQSLGVGYRGTRPDSWILREVYMSDDPDAEERDLAIEKARRESPLVDLDWKITKLLEAADDGDPYAEGQAIQLAMQWIPMARQAMEGLLTPAPKEEVKPQQSMVPLLPTQGGGGGVASG